MEESTSSDNLAANVKRCSSSSDDFTNNNNNEFNTNHSKTVYFPNRDPKFFPPIPRSNFQRNLMSRFITYQIERDSDFTLKGFRYHFQLSFEGEFLYHSKTKSKRPEDPVYISSGNQMHFSQEKFDAVLLTNNQNSFFSLRKDNEMGEELLTIEIFTTSRSLPRTTKMNIFEKMPFIPNKVHSLLPEFKNGAWQLSFLGKQVISSIKNCILVGDDNLPYFMIRRISQDIIEIDAPQIFPPLSIFGLGLAIWIS